MKENEVLEAGTEVFYPVVPRENMVNSVVKATTKNVLYDYDAENKLTRISYLMDTGDLVKADITFMTLEEANTERAKLFKARAEDIEKALKEAEEQAKLADIAKEEENNTAKETKK